MKAVAKLAPKAGSVGLIDAPMPERRTGEVLIRIIASGICGTDVSLWKWHESIAASYSPELPLILGHEFAGEVIECDPNNRVKVGDVVAVNPQVSCGLCVYCQQGHPTLCDTRKLMGGNLHDGWAEYVTAPVQNCYRLPEGTDPAVAPLLEPFTVAYHAVGERVRPRTGDAIAIIGAGPISLMITILAKASGAANVFVSGLTADLERLRLAEQLGAIPVNVEQADLAKTIKSIAPEGANVVYETSGSSVALQQAIQSVTKGGQIGVIGLCHKESSIESLPVVLREISITGSRGYNDTTWNRMMPIVKEHSHNILKLATHEVKLDQFEDALKMVEQRVGAKIILRP